MAHNPNFKDALFLNTQFLENKAAFVNFELLDMANGTVIDDLEHLL